MIDATQVWTAAPLKTAEEVREMLHEAQDRLAWWMRAFEVATDEGDRKRAVEAARNAKALEGVVGALQWMLGRKDNPMW